MMVHKGFLAVTLIILIGSTLPSLADEMLIPRLGYPVGAPARIYLDVVPNEVREADAKAKKEADKAQREAQRQAELAARKQAEKMASLLKNDDDPQIMQIRPLETPPSDTKPDNKDAKKAVAAKSPTKPQLTKAQAEAAILESRKKAEAQRITRSKVRLAALQEKYLNTPVDGIFYLYSLKDDRLLYDEAALPQPAGPNGIAPYFIEFREKPVQGLYQVAVKGSGHLSETPLWISDSVYWDALKPVANNFTKAHCPLEQGRYRIVQQCYQLEVFPTLTAATQANPLSQDKAQLVQGGWYSEPTTDMVKSTANIADMAQVLLQLYRINPKSFKYLEMPGTSYEQSPYPDILDEANWGLQYLLTIQQPDGSFPQGIRRREAGEKDLYFLAPTTPEAQARSVMALATAARVFKDQDLSLSVKFMRAAERGWQNLEQTQTTLNPQLRLLATGALSQASDDPTYTQAFQQAKLTVKELTPETALLLGDIGTDIPVQEVSSVGTSKEISSVLPWLVELQRKQTKNTPQLAQFVTNLFGYEHVSFQKDDDLVVADAKTAPLQWFASKTGEVAERLSYGVGDTLGHKSAKTESDTLKALEKKEKEAKDRIQEGYDQLSLSPEDNIYLAYTLALLNQQAAPAFDPNAPAQSQTPKAKQHIEPVGGPKGYWPKAI